MGASPAPQALPGFTCTVEGCRKFHEYFRDWEAFLRHYRTHHPDLHLRLVGLPRRSVLWKERWAYCAIFSQLTPTAVLFKHNAQRGDPVAEDFLSKPRRREAPPADGIPSDAAAAQDEGSNLPAPSNESCRPELQDEVLAELIAGQPQVLLPGCSVEALLTTDAIPSAAPVERLQSAGMTPSEAENSLPGFTCSVQGCRKFHEYLRDWDSFLRHCRSHHPDLHQRLLSLPRRSEESRQEKLRHCALFSRLTPTTLLLLSHNAQTSDPRVMELLGKPCLSQAMYMPGDTIHDAATEPHTNMLPAHRASKAAVDESVNNLSAAEELPAAAAKELVSTSPVARETEASVEEKTDCMSEYYRNKVPAEQCRDLLQTAFPTKAQQPEIHAMEEAAACLVALSQYRAGSFSKRL